MAEILRFEFNVPEEVSLKFANGGREVTGRYGPQVMYTLDDDRVMFLDPAVASKIAQMGIGAHERFTITKQQRRQDGKSVAEWAIQRVDPPARHVGTGEVAPSPAPMVPAPQNRVAPQNAETSADANTFRNFLTENTVLLTGIFCASFDALENTKRYAESKGRKLDFNEEDIRATANTVYIQLEKRGVRWASR